MKPRIALLLSLVLASSVGLAQVPQFVNGDFELPVTPHITTIYTGSSDLVGWRVMGGSVEVVSAWQPAGGSQVLDTVGIQVRGAIEQDLTFVDAGQYHITFDLSRNPLITPPAQLGVWYKPPSATSFIGLGFYEFSESVTAVDMKWRAEGTGAFTFVPGVYTFAFASLAPGVGQNNNTWGGPAIDSVQLVAGASNYAPTMPPDYVLPPPLPFPTPEPTAGGLAAGAGLLAFACWRRTKH